MSNKSNKWVVFEKDSCKSYVYITERGKDIGMLLWDSEKKRWVFDDYQRKGVK